MKHILCLAGRKGSGKTTAADLLLRNQCELLGSTTLRIRRLALADPLKAICMEILGLTDRQCYGSEADKNTHTDIWWGNFPCAGSDVPRLGLMTAREVLQHVGTEIFRRMRPSCWIEACLRDALVGPEKIVVVDDARFPDEIAALRRHGKAVLFTRGVAGDGHSSENSLPGPEAFDLVIDNTSMTVNQAHQSLLTAMREWGWIPPI
jgi:hypothetical protein